MVEETILGYLEKKVQILYSSKFAAEQGLEHNEVVNVIKNLHSFHYVVAQDIKRETWVLTDEGKKYVVEGSPEVQLFLAVPEEDSISKDEYDIKGLLSEQRSYLCSKMEKSCYRFDLRKPLEGNWKELQFKEYNFNAKGQSAEGGHLHLLLKVK